MAVGKKTVESVLNSTGLAVDKISSVFAGLLAAFLILYGGYVLYDNIYTQSQAYSSSWEILKYKPGIIDDETLPLTPSELAAINADYRFWLTIYDTDIDYPVMQGKDDLYYASHDVTKKTSLTGSLYLAAANSPDLSDSYNLVYGHHLDVNALFGPLDNYHDEAFFASHKPGVIVTNDSVYDVEIFAIMDTTAYDDMVYDPGNRDIASLLSYIKSKSVIFDDLAAKDAVKILAMSTCEDALTNGRLVVFASLHKRTTGGDDPTPGDDDPPVDEPTDTSGGKSPKDYLPKLGFLEPTGSSYTDSWALVNLVCLLLTLFLMLPLGFAKAKYRRGRLMGAVNEGKRELWELEDGTSSPSERENARWIRDYALHEKQQKEPAAAAEDVTRDDYSAAVDALYYKDEKFRRRFRIGVVLEAVIVVLAVVLFVLTEDMRLPMSLIDVWTPFQLLLLAACWIVDVRLIRYRDNRPQQGQWEDAASAGPTPTPSA